MALFSWRKTRQPSPGAEAYAFARGFTDPLQNAFTGRGTPYQCGAISPVQPAPMYYPAVNPTTAGLGGLIYSSSYWAPLMASTRRG